MNLATTPSDRPTFYASLLPDLRAAAWLQGYALGVHGTMKRDMDIIAVPWIDQAAGADALASALSEAAGGDLLRVDRQGRPVGSAKPHGRRAYTIILPRVDRIYPHPGGWAVFIDLSVMPLLEKPA